MAISNALKKIYASADHTVTMLEMLRLAHPQFSTDHHITNDISPWSRIDDKGVMQVWEPIPFEIKLPSRDGSGRMEMEIVIANVSPILGREIEAIVGKAQPLTVEYFVYLTTESGPQNDPVNLYMTDIQITDEFVSGAASLADIINARFPSITYHISQFPGLDR